MPRRRSVLAHTIKGAARAVAAIATEDAACEVEMAAKEAKEAVEETGKELDLTKAKELAPQLREAVDLLVKEVQANADSDS